MSFSSLEEPLSDGSKDSIFISKTYDATSHFESMHCDLESLYKRITGKPLDLASKARKSQAEEQQEMEQK